MFHSYCVSEADNSQSLLQLFQLRFGGVSLQMLTHRLAGVDQTATIESFLNSISESKEFGASQSFSETDCYELLIKLDQQLYEAAGRTRYAVLLTALNFAEFDRNTTVLTGASIGHLQCYWHSAAEPKFNWRQLNWRQTDSCYAGSGFAAPHVFSLAKSTGQIICMASAMKSYPKSGALKSRTTSVKSAREVLSDPDLLGPRMATLCSIQV